MRRSLILTTAATLAACGISARDPVATKRPLMAVEQTAPGTYQFTVRAATYGPNREDVKPPTDCTPGPAIQRDTTTWTRSDGSTINVVTIHNQTEGPFCGITYDSTGDAYIGGELGAWAQLIDTTKGLFNMPADVSRMAQTVDVPMGAIIGLEAQTYPGYVFLGWRITRADGSSYVDSNRILQRTAGTTDDDDFLAEYQKGSSPPPPPPPPPPPSDTTKCDDPTVPGCGNPPH